MIIIPDLHWKIQKEYDNDNDNWLGMTNPKTWMIAYYGAWRGHIIFIWKIRNITLNGLKPWKWTNIFIWY